MSKRARVVAGALWRRTICGCWIGACSAGCQSPEDDSAFDTGVGDEAPGICEANEPGSWGETAGARELSRVAIAEDIPGISTQSSERGREIGTLHSHAGRVYLGYGDYSENTGPLQIISYDLLDDAFYAHGLVTTEELQYFSSIGGALFTSDVDPHGHEAIGSVFRASEPCGPWESGKNLKGVVHAYGLLARDEVLWLGTGSLSGEPAQVVTSTDQGESWTEQLAIASPPDAFSRVLHIGSAGEDILITGRRTQADNTKENFAQRLQVDTDTWAEVAGIPDSDRLVPVELVDTTLVLGFSTDVGKGGVHISTHELVGDEMIESDILSDLQIVNWSVAENTDGPAQMWAIVKRGESTLVEYTEDFTAWAVVADISALDEEGASAIAFADNTVHLATRMGSYWVIESVFE